MPLIDPEQALTFRHSDLKYAKVRLATSRPRSGSHTVFSLYDACEIFSDLYEQRLYKLETERESS